VRAYARLTLAGGAKITLKPSASSMCPLARPARRRFSISPPLSSTSACRQISWATSSPPHQGGSCYELYQHDAWRRLVASLKPHQLAGRPSWSPQISHRLRNDPELTWPDLPVRLALYLRLAEVEESKDIESRSRPELTDRFRFAVRPHCRASVCRSLAISRFAGAPMWRRVEAGPRARISFRDNTFRQSERLDPLIGDQDDAKSGPI